MWIALDFVLKAASHLYTNHRAWLLSIPCALRRLHVARLPCTTQTTFVEPPCESDLLQDLTGFLGPSYTFPPSFMEIQQVVFCVILLPQTNYQTNDTFLAEVIMKAVGYL